MVLFNSSNISFKWLLVFIFFSITYLIVSSIMYFNTSLQLKTNQTKINTLNLTWKW